MMMPKIGMLIRCTYSQGMGLVVKVNYASKNFIIYWMNRTESHFSTTHNTMLTSWLDLGSVKVF